MTEKSALCSVWVEFIPRKGTSSLGTEPPRHSCDSDSAWEVHTYFIRSEGRGKYGGGFPRPRVATPRAEEVTMSVPAASQLARR
jgi:hypothetical protein